MIAFLSGAVTLGALVALDKFTGKRIWKTPVNGDCWSTPAIIDLPGGQQPVFNEDGSICIVFNGERIGFTHFAIRKQPGTEHYEIRSEASFVLRFLGIEKKIQLKSRDVVGADLALVDFAYEYHIDGSELRVTGRRESGELAATVVTAGTPHEQRLPVFGRDGDVPDVVEQQAVVVTHANQAFIEGRLARVGLHEHVEVNDAASSRDVRPRSPKIAAHASAKPTSASAPTRTRRSRGST